MRKLNNIEHKVTYAMRNFTEACHGKGVVMRAVVKSITDRLVNLGNDIPNAVAPTCDYTFPSWSNVHILYVMGKK